MEKTNPRRSLLYVPGSSLKMIHKAIGLDSDSLIFDLEDSVSMSEKDQARQNIIKSISSAKQSGKEILVRVNALTSYLGIQDILSLVPEAPDGLIIPKADERAAITADMLIGAIEQDLNWQLCTVKLILLMETCNAIVNAHRILKVSKRIGGVQFGAEDLTKELEISRTRDGNELYHARSILVFEGKAAGIDIIDSPYTDINDLEGLTAETVRIKGLGMTGKACIHPSQISIVNDAFTPKAEDVAYAHKIVEAFEHAVREGKGACTLDGKMVDYPIVERARRLLNKANRGRT